MSFTQAHNYILSLVNLPRKEYMADPSKCDIYMKRLRFFLDILENPENKIPHVIHVAGTSGKGSVTKYLHSILHASGKKIGSTASPAPSNVLERWQIDDAYMTEQQFLQIFPQIKTALDKYARTSPYDMPSYFEVMEAIGFIWFAEQQVDWLVLETGCGGRFDSGNIIKHKDAAVITNIGLDHTEILGSTKKEIAWEKAGIISVKTQVFTSETEPTILPIIEQEVEKTNSTLKIVQNQASDIQISLNGTSFTYDNIEIISFSFTLHNHAHSHRLYPTGRKSARNFFP